MRPHHQLFQYANSLLKSSNAVRNSKLISVLLLQSPYLSAVGLRLSGFGGLEGARCKLYLCEFSVPVHLSVLARDVALHQQL